MHFAPQTTQVLLKDIHGADLPFLWLQVRQRVELDKRSPTVLIIGSAVELENRREPIVAGELLEQHCRAVAELLIRHGMNLVSDACPGIPHLIERAYAAHARRGAALDLSVLRSPHELETERAYSPTGFPACGDIQLFCGCGFEMLSIINTYCADLVLVVGGGLGSLMEGIIAVVNDLPVICFSPAGGISGQMQTLFERYRSRYKHLRITTCETLAGLDELLADFAADFRKAESSTRLHAFLERLQPTSSEKRPHTEIYIAENLQELTYTCGERTLRLPSPTLVIDDARILAETFAGAAISSLLASGPRQYSYESVKICVPAGIPALVWCPSIDTFLLTSAMRPNLQSHYGSALDIGTGTGVIAIWLAAGGRVSSVLGIDSNADATRVADFNAAAAGLAEQCRIRTVRYQDLRKEENCFDLITCTPPYIPLLTRQLDIDDSCFGLNLVIDLLTSVEQILTPGGECYLTLSSSSWIDETVSGLMQRLIGDRRATLIQERLVPFKLAGVLVDTTWLEALVLHGGVFYRDTEHYAYWHRVQVWRISSSPLAVQSDVGSDADYRRPLDS